MITRLGNIWRPKHGASLAEFALILPGSMLLTFGVLEVGYLMWQVQQGEIAAKRAVRLAATRSLLDVGAIADCGPSTPVTAVAGQDCFMLTGGDTSLWAQCRGDGSGSAACGPDVAVLAAEIGRFYPRAEPADILVQFHGSGLGFQGLGHPVPVITVKLENVEFEFLTLSALSGLVTFEMPDMSASATAEDLQNG
jgi:TadE-like protein